MRQLCLIKLNITNIDENYLSYDVVFIARAYFLNKLHPSLKYAIQFFVTNALKTSCRDLKLIFVSHLNPFEFFFHCKKQVEGTRAKSSE
jgi:hypothetical protein